MPNHSVLGWLVGLLGVSLLLGSFFSWLTWLSFCCFFESTARQRKWQVPPDQTERIPVQPILDPLRRA